MNGLCDRWNELGHIPNDEMREFLSGKSDQEYVMEGILYRCPDLVNVGHFSVIDRFAENSEMDCDLFLLICKYSKIDIF